MSEKESHSNSLIMGETPEEEIRWFMFLRILLVSLLLGMTVIYQANRVDAISPLPSLLSLYGLIALSFGVNLISALLLPKLVSLHKFALSQIVYDLFFVTLLLYVTEAIAGTFIFLYLIVIIFSALMFSRKGALLTSFGASGFYTILLLLQPSRADFFYHAFVTSAAFIVVGLLSGYMTEQLRQAGHKLIETQKDVRRLADFNQAIINNIETGILTTDVRGRITSLNPAGERLMGLDYPLIEGEYLQRILPEFQSIIERGETLSQGKQSSSLKRLEQSFTRPDGRTFRFGFSISPLKGEEGNEEGKIIIFEDRTQLSEMERRLRLTDKLAAIGQLAAGMAHEIRNPLASMSGSIEMLKSKVPLDSEEAKLMNIVMRETERLNTLLTEFLEFVKPTKSKEMIFSVKDLIDETIVAIKLSPEISADIKFMVSESLAPGFYLKGDPDKIKQVFWNLFLNACQAMPFGGKIEISAKVESGRVLIRVRDTGTGMNEEVLGKIFDPFFTTKDRGTGLGLSTSYRIIEAHEGMIQVESHEGKGSTFLISFPLVNREEMRRA